MIERKITNQMLEDFAQNLFQDEKSNLTIEKCSRDVNHFVECLSENRIDKAVVLAYKASLENEYAVASANSMIASLNAFFRFMSWQELCVKQFKVQKQTFYKEEKELTKEEYIRLVRTAEQKHNEAIVSREVFDRVQKKKLGARERT